MFVKDVRLAPRLSLVTYTKGSVYYSDHNPIACFDNEGNITVTENLWANRVARHLNYISRDKSIRVPHDEFTKKLAHIAR
jgi:hypothetical protein